jgi:predicted TIM-barrel fold metal-dependent hydrolase
MFKQAPNQLPDGADPIEITIGEMDHCGVAIGMIGAYGEMAERGEPQQDLAVKLMLKWPGLHYMTSAFAPKYSPKAIVDYANSRGADKVMYAGYYPMGLSLRRIFDELPNVPLKDHVWPKFLRENAMRLFQLDAPS